jgi:hypothetical protein
MTPLLKPTITTTIAPLHAAVLRNTLLQIANAEYPNKDLTEGEFTLHLQELALTALIATGTAEVNTPQDSTSQETSQC